MVDVVDLVNQRFLVAVQAVKDDEDGDRAGDVGLGRLNLDIGHFIANIVDGVHDGIQLVCGINLHIQIHRRFAGLFKHGEECRGGEQKHGGNDGADVKAGARGDADGGGRPHTRRCCQSRDRDVVFEDDSAGAEKTDAGNDLRRNAHRVTAELHGVHGVDADQSRKGRTDAQDNVCAKACGSAVLAALIADTAAENSRQKQANRHGKRCELRQDRGDKIH